MNQISAELEAKQLVEAIARINSYSEYLSLLQRYDHRCRARLTARAMQLMEIEERCRIDGLRQQWEQKTAMGVIDL